jgi:hypothetical protein
LIRHSAEPACFPSFHQKIQYLFSQRLAGLVEAEHSSSAASVLGVAPSPQKFWNELPTDHLQVAAVAFPSRCLDETTHVLLAAHGWLLTLPW